MRASTPLPKDPDFYLDDGDCYIAVEGTLFRLHKFLLKRDSSVFRDILSGGAGLDRPSTEGSPIHLQDTTYEEFRALCWIMYAMPAEIKAQADQPNLPLKNISRLLSIALISRQYKFTSFEAWARNILDGHFLKTYPHVCSPHDIDRLVRYYKSSGDTAILGAIQKAILQSLDREKPTLGPWLRRRNVVRSPSDPNRALDSVQMLCLAETHGWRELQGNVYYRLLCDTVGPSANSEAKDVFDASTLLSSITSTTKGLSVQQRFNLLQGFVAIMAAWDRITRLAFDKAVVCNCFVFIQCGVHRQEVWSELLGEACKRFCAADILERIAYMNAKRTSVSKLILVGWTCRPKLAIYMSELEEEIEGSMADYFLGKSTEKEVLLAMKRPSVAK